MYVNSTYTMHDKTNDLHIFTLSKLLHVYNMASYNYYISYHCATLDFQNKVVV